MRHPSSRAFFAYWNRRRQGARAPDRADIDPAAVRHLLGDIFVIAYQSGLPFRVAGTRVCALAGQDLKDRSFVTLFTRESQSEIEEITSVVAEEALAAIAGITTAQEDNGTTAHLELLLLPFNTRPHTPVSVTGVLAALDSDCARLSDFTLSSWRYLYQPESLMPRLIRKLKIARGLMVYEGLK